MDSGALFAASRSFAALADRADSLRYEVAGTAAEVRGASFNWKGPSSAAFADLVNSMSGNMTQASQSFRQIAGQLNTVAQKVQAAEDAKRKASIAAGVGIVVTGLAILQLGLDPVNDAAAAGVDGGAAAAETAAVGAEVAAEAEAASAFAAIAEVAMAAVRGLGAFLAPHAGMAAFAGGQAIFVDLLATGRIDWRDVGSQVALAGLIGVSTSAGSAALGNLTRDGATIFADSEGQQLLQQNLNLEKQLADPSHQWQYNVLTGGPVSDQALQRAAGTGLSDAVVLRGSPANTFASGKYDMYSSDQPYLLFKAGDNPEQGSFFSLKPPAGEAQARIDSAIKPIWTSPEGAYQGRSALNEGYVYVVENPTDPVALGPASTQGGAYAGGRLQAFVPGALDASAPRLRLIARYDLNNPPDWVLQLYGGTSP